MIKAKKLIAILMVVAMSSGFGVMNVSAENDTETEAVEIETVEETAEEKDADKVEEKVEEKSDTETESKLSVALEASIPDDIRKMMTILKTFKIIPDYYDYNIPLTYEVPRSDFAASVARIMGKTEYDGSGVYFYDVPKNYWAYNEISNLTEMGIISGSGDKTFNPGEPITKAAAYTILLSAMGYREYAERAGGYPNGYINVASNIKLSRGVSGSDKVTMSDMLHILYNALTVKIMEVGSLSGNSITFETSEDETLISKYRNIYYDEGNVNGANTITTSGVTIDKDKALIDSETYYSNGFNLLDYFGEKVEFFYEKNDLTDEKTILWVGRKNSSQEIKYISADSDASLDTDSFIYTYYDENGKRRTISIDRSALLIYNGGIIDSGYDKILNYQRYELKLITNNDKQTLIVKQYANYVVGNINTASKKIYDKNNSKAYVDLDEENYDTFSIRRMGKEEMSFEDIKKDSVLTVYLSEDKKHIEISVSDNTVNGIVEKINNDTNLIVTINGNDYRVDKNVATNIFSIGNDVTAYTNVFGEIVYVTVKQGTLQGAFLISANLDRREENMFIRLLGEDSKVTKLKCAEKVNIDGKRCKVAKDAYKAILAGESSLIPRFALIKKNKDGDITDIDTENYVKSIETSNSLRVDIPFMEWDNTEKKYKDKARLIRATANAARIGEKIVFDADTKVFVIPYVTDYENASEDDFWATTGSKLVSDVNTYAQSYKTEERIGVAKYVVLKNYDPHKEASELPILAVKITQGVDDYGTPVEVLEGYQGKTPVSIKADENASNIFSKSLVGPGDVVTLTRDGYGKVKGCNIVYDYGKDACSAITALNASLGMFVGYAHDVVGTVVKIGYASGNDFDFAIDAMSKPVIVYDKTKTKNPVSEATTDDIVTYLNDSINCSTVFIVTSRMQPQSFIIYK